MLNLNRKLGEIIMIGDFIEIKVLGIINKTVMLGVDAPKNIPVHRREVYQRIKYENVKCFDFNK